MRKTILLFFLSALHVLSYSQAGNLNPAFNTQGYVQNSNVGNFNAVAVQPDGKILAAGVAHAFHHDVFSVIRYKPDGTQDNTFADNGMQITDFNLKPYPKESSATVTCIATRNGTIVLAGQLKGLENNQISDSVAVAVYNTDGSLNTQFSGDGKQTLLLKATDYVANVAIQADGKIVVAGTAAPSRGQASCFLLRFNTDGTLDKTFDGDGVRFFDLGFLSAMTLQADGKMVVATTIVENDKSRFVLARFNTDGTFDNTFGSDGKQDDDFALFDLSFRGTSLALQADGKIVVGGYAGSTTLDFAITRYNADGSLDKTFSGDGGDVLDFGAQDHLNAVAIQQDQKIIAGGYTLKYGTDGTLTINFALARYNTDGSLDQSFSDDGKQVSDLGTHSAIYGIAIYNDQLYAVGGNELGSLGIVADYLLEEKGVITLTCPGDKTVSTDKGVCTAVVTGIDPVLSGGSATVTYTLTGATTGSGTGTASGKTYNKGVTTVTYTLTGDAAKQCSFTVTVEDKEVPVLTGVSVNPSILWPANHKMVEVTVNYNLWDNCAATATISVKGNDGATSSDWQVVDAHHVWLRAERSGSGNGRTYTITITATDASGNKATQTATVVVPHDMSNAPGKEALKVTVLPNPSQHLFTLQVQSNSNQPISVRVTNAVGKLMEVRTNTGVKGTVQLGSSYTPGIYFAEVLQGNSRTVVKLVKQSE